MAKILALLTCIFFSSAALAQKPLVWELLALTTYQTDLDEYGNLQYTPKFPSNLENDFEQVEVAISGYLIPIDLEAQTYALSKNPFSACFFCGNAGPETVIELRFTKPPGRFATDAFLMIKGKLILRRDGGGIFYILQNAEIHG